MKFKLSNGVNRARLLAVGVLVAVFAAFGLGVSTGLNERAADAAVTITSGKPPQDVDLSKLWQAWQLLDGSFVQTHASNTLPTDEEKVYGAIAGLTEAYKDPYTVFFPPQEAKAFNEEIKGSFGGVGMELGARNGLLTVVAPLKGSPAEAAGIRSGDIVTSIDGTPSENMAVEEAVRRIRGDVGTKVTLSIKRAGTTSPLSFTIVRQTIQVPIIKTSQSGDIFTIELYSFSENSVDLFRGALREFFESGDTKLVLDLRGNPGGYLDAAVEMASYFLPMGESVVTEDFQGKQQNFVHRSAGYNVFANKKLSMVVLVNEGSASASEILAGALQQHGVAKLVGTRTFGKGSVQQLVELGGGAELKITVARWLTPNGSSISDGGLQPDIKVDRTLEDLQKGLDPQKSAAQAWLATQ